jgi:hypothetical protein
MDDNAKKRGKKKNLRYEPETIEEAWAHLAVSVLELAIWDARKNRDPLQRAKAKAWLLSPAAAWMFDALIDKDFDLRAWVLNDCPEIKHK